MSQEPAARTEVQADSSVSVTVSTGPATVEIPDLAGQDLARARSKLATLGLKFGGKDEAPSDTVTKGGIIQQEPAAGTKAKRGSTVRVAVSTGPEETTNVPGLSGGSTEEAERASSNAEPVSATSRREQNRRRWTFLIAAVVLFAALTLGSVGWYFWRDVSVPDLRGKPIAEAREQVGTDFEIRSRGYLDSDQPQSTIVDQNPGPNAQASEGSTIDVRVSRG